MAAHHDTPTDSTQMRAVCDHNQVAVNHLLRLLHLSYFGSPRYKNTILKAVRSVCVYPLPIETEKDALSLNGVGKYLAKEIMKSFNVSRSNETPSLTSQTEISPAEPVYKPEQGRGPWAVMIALRLLNGSGTKESIINCIRSHNVEMVEGALDGGKWSTCIRTLQRKGIILEGSPSGNIELTALGIKRVALLKFSFDDPIRTSTNQIPVSDSNSIRQLTLDLTQDDERPDAMDHELDCKDDEFILDIPQPNSDDEIPVLSLRDRITRSNCSTEATASKRKVDEAEVAPLTSDTCCPSELPVEDGPISLSQPTTDREKRRCMSLRSVPSSSTQTFKLHQSTSHPSIADTNSELQSKEWEVVILIDRREKDHAFFQSYFTQQNVQSEVCQLAIGDYLWVAKRKNAVWHSDDVESLNGYQSDSSVDSTNQLSQYSGSKRGKPKSFKERLQDLHSSILILDCVVERKTVNDLASSIIDGRYEEQKHRLKGCGVKNCVYLVEGASLNPQGIQNRGKSSDQCRGGVTINTNAIITAMAATQAAGVATGMCRPSEEDEQDTKSYSFHVVNTRGLDHTANHLMCLHRLVEKRFYSTDVYSTADFQTFYEFQSTSSRKQRLEEVSELLVSQLRQVPGCSTHAAQAIANRFGGTFHSLHRSLSCADPTARIDTVAEVKKVSRTGAISRVGPVLSNTLVTFLVKKRSSIHLAPAHPPSVLR